MPWVATTPPGDEPDEVGWAALTLPQAHPGVVATGVIPIEEER
jgi:hypothetical protein